MDKLKEGKKAVHEAGRGLWGNGDYQGIGSVEQRTVFSCNNVT